MKIAIDKDEWYPVYYISENLEFGHATDISDEEYELLKMMEKDAWERMRNIQKKLKEYYFNVQKKSYEFPNSSSIDIR